MPLLSNEYNVLLFSNSTFIWADGIEEEVREPLPEPNPAIRFSLWSCLTVDR